jgi:multiple sugar transport system permease protein
METTSTMNKITTDRRSSSYRFMVWKQQELPGYLFVLPSFIAFLIFTAYPMIDTIIFSFQQFVGGERTWAGLLNYEIIFNYDPTWKALRNTFFYFLYLVPPGLIIVMVLSFLITLLPNKMQAFFKGAYYLPAVCTSTVIICLVWNYLYEPGYGVFNYLLSLVGIKPQLWLRSMEQAMPSLVFMMHMLGHGGSIILVCAAIGGIPTELYESARLDGATLLKQFTKITLPLIRPVLTYIIVMSSIGSLRVFGEILVMTRGGPNWATVNIAYLIYQRVRAWEYGQGSAYSMVLLGMTLVIAIALYRRINAQVEY